MKLAIISVQKPLDISDFACLHYQMEGLFRLKNEPFPYESPFDMPHEICEPYEKEAREIINKADEKEFMESMADHLMPQVL